MNDKDRLYQLITRLPDAQLGVCSIDVGNDTMQAHLSEHNIAMYSQWLALSTDIEHLARVMYDPNNTGDLTAMPWYVSQALVLIRIADASVSKYASNLHLYCLQQETS